MLTDEREALVELLEARARSEDGRILDSAKETRSFVMSTGPRPRRDIAGHGGADGGCGRYRVRPRFLPLR